MKKYMGVVFSVAMAANSTNAQMDAFSATEFDRAQPYMMRGDDGNSSTIVLDPVDHYANDAPGMFAIDARTASNYQGRELYLIAGDIAYPAAGISDLADKYDEFMEDGVGATTIKAYELLGGAVFGLAGTAAENIIPVCNMFCGGAVGAGAGALGSYLGSTLGEYDANQDFYHTEVLGDPDWRSMPSDDEYPLDYGY